MGAGNVKRAFARWGNLPGAAFRVLVFMAVTSLDDDDPPLFWGGRESLAVALGRVVPARGDDASEHEREAAFQAVKRAVKDLTREGAITVKEAGRPGSNAVYALNLTRRTGDGKRPPMGDGNRPARGTETVRLGDGIRTPKEDQEKEGLREEESVDLRCPRTGIARAYARDIKDSSIKDGPTCGCGVLLDPDGSCFRCRGVA